MINRKQHCRQNCFEATELRKRAEAEVETKDFLPLANQTREEIQQMIHELRVHQIELKMQNEELRNVQNQIEEARLRYFDLYDLAPVGYCMISEKGIILEQT